MLYSTSVWKQSWPLKTPVACVCLLSISWEDFYLTATIISGSTHFTSIFLFDISISLVLYFFLSSLLGLLNSMKHTVLLLSASVPFLILVLFHVSNSSFSQTCIPLIKFILSFSQICCIKHADESNHFRWSSSAKAQSYNLGMCQGIVFSTTRKIYYTIVIVVLDKEYLLMWLLLPSTI